MTGKGLISSPQQLYYFTGCFGVLGFVSYFWAIGPQPALSFAVGAVGSFGNLWLWDWLSHAIEPGNRPKNNWKAGLFVGRYLVLCAAGYVIVKALGANAFALIVGLFTSTAAVVVSLLLEIVQGFLPKGSHH